VTLKSGEVEEVVNYSVKDCPLALQFFGRHTYLTIGEVIRLPVRVRVFMDKQNRPVLNLEPAVSTSNF